MSQFSASALPRTEPSDPAVSRADLSEAQEVLETDYYCEQMLTASRSSRKDPVSQLLLAPRAVSCYFLCHH